MSEPSQVTKPAFLRIHASFFVLAALLGMSSRDPARIGAWVVIMFVSVLWHELGHVVAARAFGYTPRIELHGLGGTTHFDRMPDGSLAQAPSPLRSAVISFAGPFAGIVLGGVVFYVAKALRIEPQTQGSLANAVVYYALVVNWLWSAFNLLPVLPLDGGNITRAALDGLTGGKGLKGTHALSMLVSIGLALFFLNKMMLWGAAMMALFALQNGRGLFAKPAEPADAARPAPPEPPFSQQHRALLEAMPSLGPDGVERAKALVARASSPEERVAAAQALSFAYAVNGDAERAAIVVDTMIPEEQRTATVMARVAVARGDAERALELYAQDRARGSLSQQELQAAWRAEAPLLVALGRVDALLDRWRSEPTLRAGGFASGNAAAEALFRGGYFAECARLCAELFEKEGHPTAAYNAACCHAKMGDIGEGIRWLNRATAAGFAKVSEVETDEDLAPLRGHEGYAQALAQVRANAA